MTFHSSPQCFVQHESPEQRTPQWVWSLLQALFPEIDQWVSLYWSQAFLPGLIKNMLHWVDCAGSQANFPFPTSSSRTSLGPASSAPLTELNCRLTQLQPTPIRNSLEGCTPTHSVSQLRVAVHPYLRWIQQLAPEKPWRAWEKTRAVEIPHSLLLRSQT